MKRIILFFIIVFVVFTVYFNYQISKKNENPLGQKEFEIQRGEGVKIIAEHLFGQGIIKRPFWFKFYVAVSGRRSRFVDGLYNVRTDWNIKEVIDALLDQPKAKEIEITLLEGWNTDEIDKYLFEQGLIEKEDVVSASKAYKSGKWDFLKDRPWTTSLEGYLYPDTYRVYKQSSAEEIVEKMLSNFDRKLTPDLRQEIGRQGKKIFNVVTMASIVEKEMFGYDDRRIVAEIFWKRIKAGIPLQSDATINFITNKGMVQPTYADLKIDNKYNTYKYYGLPPGPISNPSIEAIKATIYPAETAYWYFLTTPDGKIIYSKTHDEHLANKRKYLK